MGFAMHRMLKATKSLARNRKGAIALMVAISAPVMIGTAALAIDFGTWFYVDGKLQGAADAAALAGLQVIERPADVPAIAQTYATNNVPSNYGTVVTPADVVVGIWDPAARTFTPGTTPDTNAVRVTAIRSEARGNRVPTVLAHMFGEAPDLEASATAARQLNIQYEPPVSTNLSNEAHDFNEIYAYCFNHAGTGSAESRRSQMTLVSNNYRTGRNVITESGGVITQVPADPLVWPECRDGESLSFRLRNLRSAKNEWENGRRPAPASITTFNHFTDTRIDRGNERYDGLSNVTILETVRCDSQALCTPGSPGSPIRTGRNRTPTFSSQPCEPGKFMYFGWEDRPPQLGGSDRDYDDIRILMRCPRQGRLGDGFARLVG
jgi:Flp pilus assembly protein TadG